MKRAVRILMALLLVMMFSGIAAANVTYETQWPVDKPSAIAVGPSGNVYIASVVNNRVEVYDSSGTFLTQWSVNNPSGIAVNSADNVYVASAADNLIEVYDSSGNFLTQWSINNPSGVAVNSADDVYVASAANNLIRAYDASGNYLTQWIVNSPAAIAVSSAGNIYVADANGSLITVFDSHGGYVNQWDMAAPFSLAADLSGNIFITVNYDSVVVFTSGGSYLDQWGNSGTGVMQFNDPAGIAIDQAGNLYIADMGNNRVQNFSISHTITSEAGDNGTISPIGPVNKNPGDSQTYTITPDSGYRVASVVVDSWNLGAITSYTFSNINRNHKISATFVTDNVTYTIASSAGAHGTISPLGSVIKNTGDSQTYTITPDTGYRVASVIVDGWNLGAITSYIFSSVTGNHTISATFALDAYTITSSAGDHGSISPLGTVTKSTGDSQTYTITPAAGYRVASVLVDSWNLGAITSYTFSNLSGNHTISATFVADVVTYTITSSTGDHGSVAPLNTVTKNAGDSQTYIITPAAGYRVAGVVVDGWNLGAITSYTFSNLSTNHKISATFELDAYTITSSAGDHGSISPLGTVTKSTGDSQTYTITPAAGYRVASVLVDSWNLGAITSYTFSNISGNHTISATFVTDVVTYTITSSAGAHGTISPFGTVIKNAGSSQTYTITPAAGYRVASVVLDSWNLGAITNYTFSNISGNHTISASFVPDTYTITSTAGINGAISPAGTVTKNSGSSQTYTFTPAAGYRVNRVYVDGFNIGAVSSYTFSNITANHRIYVMFALNTYTITSSAGDHGTISPLGTVVKGSGTSQTYTITPDPGYRVASVYVDGFNLGAITSWTFSNITRNHKISVTFR